MMGGGYVTEVEHGGSRATGATPGIVRGTGRKMVEDNEEDGEDFGAGDGAKRE